MDNTTLSAYFYALTPRGVPTARNAAEMLSMDICSCIGPAMAERISEFRKQGGKFTAPEDLLHNRSTDSQKRNASPSLSQDAVLRFLSSHL
jgi:hypothetical protein